MLLTEYNDFNYTIDEDVKERPMRVSGVFQKCQEKNANGRVYTKGLWEKVLNDEKTKRRLKERRILGELDHPKDGKTSLMRAAMVISDIGLQDDGFVRGAYEVLNTPSGQVLRELHRAGVRLGISSRGDGEVEHTKDGQMVMPESYRFETFDVVLDPSVEEAFPSILKEAIQSARDLEERLFTESLPQLVEKFEKLTTQVKEACACHLTTAPKVEAEAAVDAKTVTEEDTTTMNVMETQEYKDLLAKFETEKSRADAATATAEELLIQARTAQWNAGHMKESLGQTRTLGEKYETAKSIIEEMAEELKGVRALWMEHKALRKVAASMYEYLQDQKLAGAVKGMLSGLPQGVREAIMPFIEKCRTEAEIKATVGPILESVKASAKPVSVLPKKEAAVVPSKTKIVEAAEKNADAGKPLAEKEAVAPEKKDTYTPRPGASRVIESMGSGRADAIRLTKSLVEARKGM